MVIGLFKHNNPLAFLLLILLACIPFMGEKNGLGALSSTAYHPAFLEQQWLTLLSWLGAGNNWINNMATVAILLIQALVLNKIASDNKLLEHSGMLPAMSFLLLNALAPVSINAFILLGNLATMLLIRFLMLLYKINKPNNLLLAAGCIAGVLAVFKTPYSIVYIWLMASLLIMRPASLKEAIVCTIGFLLPVYFLVAGLYLVDKPILQNMFSAVAFDFYLPSMTAVEISRLSFFVALPWIGLAVGNRYISKMMILNRKSYIVIMLLFLTLMVASALNTVALASLLNLVMVPGALMMTHLFAYHKKNLLPNTIVLCIVLISLFR